MKRSFDDALGFGLITVNAPEAAPRIVMLPVMLGNPLSSNTG